MSTTPENFDWLQAARERGVPFLEHLEIQPVSAGEGRAAFEMTVREFHLRTLGMVHGGVTASLLDTAVGFAALTVAPPGHHLVTVQLNVNFTRPVPAGETLRATAEVLHSGKRTAVVNGEVRNAAGELAATATATLMYLPMPHESAR